MGLTASEAVPGEEGTAFILLDEALPVCYMEARNVEDSEMEQLEGAVRSWPQASERFKARVENLSRRRVELLGPPEGAG